MTSGGVLVQVADEGPGDRGAGSAARELAARQPSGNRRGGVAADGPVRGRSPRGQARHPGAAAATQPRGVSALVWLPPAVVELDRRRRCLTRCVGAPSPTRPGPPPWSRPSRSAPRCPRCSAASRHCGTSMAPEAVRAGPSRPGSGRRQNRGIAEGCRSRSRGHHPQTMASGRPRRCCLPAVGATTSAGLPRRAPSANLIPSVSRPGSVRRAADNWPASRHRSPPVAGGDPQPADGIAARSPPGPHGRSSTSGEK